MKSPFTNTLLAFSLTLTIFTAGCKTSEKADQVFYNGKVYLVDSAFSVVTAFAVADGRILATGSDEEMLQYETEQKIDLQGKSVFPGFHDAHCHFYGYGTDLAKIWLTGTASFEDAIDTLVAYQDKRIGGWIFGRGWDQNDWTNKTYPDNTVLDSLWPDTPVFLLRVDGHAAIANSAALKAAGIDENTTVQGGEIRKMKGKLTGILVDAAIDIVYAVIPDPSPASQVQALLSAQKDCFAVGLTHVTDAGIKNAGLKYETIMRMDSLQSAGSLFMRINAMADLSESSKYIGQDPVRTDRLAVTGFKLYADGALGSRGACLKAPYNDQAGHYGFLIGTPAKFDSICKVISESNMQLNTHCIGDSSHKLMLEMYNKYLQGKTDRRWRIEHAQVIDTNDLHYYSNTNIIPSVQPVHATSDMYWAGDRLGTERVKGAYAYKWMLNQRGLLAAGSDFPVEYNNPLFGFYAAVERKDQKAYPEGGFQPENALTREEALRAMTIWAAYAAFNDQNTGSLEPGKFADFVILEKDIMTIEGSELFKVKVDETWIGGKNVYRRLP